MPYEYRVADAEGLVHVTAWGEADLVEIVALLRQMEADTRVRPGMPVLVDAWPRGEGPFAGSERRIKFKYVAKG